MKRFLHNYGVLGLSLITLFASGISIGRFSARQLPSPVAPALDVAGGPASWVTLASRGLVRDLELDEAQLRQVRQRLEPVAQALYSDQERTLFQMHLRLLMLHDTLAKEGGLTEPQQVRLAHSRAKLKDLIIRKFPSMVRSNPSLAIESNPP